MVAVYEFLPARSGGRGTMRSMVEGRRASGGFAIAPSTARLRRTVPLPRQAWGGVGK